MFILDFPKEPPTNKINSPHRKIIFSKLRLSPCFMAKSLFHSYIPLCHGSIPGFSWLNDVKSIFSSFFTPCPHRFLHRSTPRPSSARSGVQVPLLELGTGIRQHQLRFRQKKWDSQPGPGESQTHHGWVHVCVFLKGSIK